jgi:hypothetical protein
MKNPEQEDILFALFMASKEIGCKHPVCERYQPYQTNPNWTTCRIVGDTGRKFAMTVEQGSTNDMSTDDVEKKVDAKRSGCGASTSLHIRRNWMVIASWMTFCESLDRSLELLSLPSIHLLMCTIKGFALDEGVHRLSTTRRLVVDGMGKDA